MRRHSDERYRLQVRSVGGGGLEAQRLELRGHIRDGQSSAAGRRCPPLEQVVGEIPQVRIHGGRARSKPHQGGGGGGGRRPFGTRRAGGGGEREAALQGGSS